MATFGKKTTGGAQSAAFGRRASAAPAPVSDELSPKARAFLEAERARNGAPGNAAFPTPPGAATPSAFPTSPSASYTPPGKPAGKPVFGRRIIARIVDELIILIPMLVILSPMVMGALGNMTTALPGSPEEARANIELVKVGAILFLAQAAYGIAMESSGFQATLGKLMVGALVTGSDGNKPSLGAVIMRNTLARLIVNVIPLYVGYLIGLGRADRRGVHDLIAGTMVRARAGEGQAAMSDVFA
ncbi:RDD family protein [Hyphomonas johnsonii]|uniref:Serine/threonine protein kinase n=1 Tax=Hyphomonas johnsonii MHS-2 TaxID=1280950 RepID=A0A059FP11_9PROT|nr:RDD family protein [Hyphomonas johnsonii]KCZ92405.1 serine/threonine protein kinase [Hyphomonas johnsonii MHS-2]